MVVPYARTLHNRYPFSASGQDAALSDVADFYRPTRGAVWAFYTEALTGDIARQGDQYDFVTRLGSDMSDNWRPELRSFYQDVAASLVGADSVLLFGGGTGASSAMEHLLTELRLHHPATAAKLIGVVVIDEHHTTEDQLLARARAAFASSGGRPPEPVLGAAP